MFRRVQPWCGSWAHTACAGRSAPDAHRHTCAVTTCNLAAGRHRSARPPTHRHCPTQLPNPPASPCTTSHPHRPPPPSTAAAPPCRALLPVCAVAALPGCLRWRCKRRLLRSHARVDPPVLISALLHLPVCFRLLAGTAQCGRCRPAAGGDSWAVAGGGCSELMIETFTYADRCIFQPRLGRAGAPSTATGHRCLLARPAPAGFSGLHAAGARAGSASAAAAVHQRARQLDCLSQRPADLLRQRTSRGAQRSAVTV